MTQAVRLSSTFFYSLEKSIKAYRQFAQARITRAGIDITLDQWLVLKMLQDYPDITLQQVAADVFKDVASVTRIVQLLESKGHVMRLAHPDDGRRSSLSLTREGTFIVRALEPIVTDNRKRALKGVKSPQLDAAHVLLGRITENCLTSSAR